MYDPPPNSQTPPPAPNVTNLQRVKGCCEICVDFGYFKNFLFYFKAIAIILGIFGSSAAGWQNPDYSAAQFFEFVAVTVIIAHTVIITTYLLSCHLKITRVPWVIVQLCIDAYAFILYIIASSVAVAKARTICECGNLAAAAFFGFASVIVSLLEAIFFIFQWKRGDIELRTTTTITTPNPDGGIFTSTTKETIIKQANDYPVLY